MKWLLIGGFTLGAVGVLTAGSGCDPMDCDPPDQIEYGCQPLPTGSAGCVGGPTYFDGDGNKVVADPDKTYPFGCDTKLPACSHFHGGVEQAICETDGSWIIPM